VSYFALELRSVARHNVSDSIAAITARPTSDVETPGRAQLEPHELDAVVVFVRILLEWDACERRMSAAAARKGTERDDGNERSEPREVI
jgi:hypothetical protein